MTKPASRVDRLIVFPVLKGHGAYGRVQSRVEIPVQVVAFQGKKERERERTEEDNLSPVQILHPALELVRRIGLRLMLLCRKPAGNGGNHDADNRQENAAARAQGCPLWPKSAVPTRTRVEPSSMAVSKSPDIPMESVSNALNEPLDLISAKSFRKEAKDLLTAASSPPRGPTVISPRSRRCGIAERGPRNARRSSRDRKPDFEASPLVLSSRRMSIDLPRSASPGLQSGSCLFLVDRLNARKEA